MSETKNYILEWIHALKHTSVTPYIDRIVPGKPLKVVYKKKLPNIERITYQEIPFNINVDNEPTGALINEHIVEVGNELMKDIA